MYEEVKRYNNIDYLYVTADTPDEIKDNVPNVRADLPSELSFESVMSEKGFYFGDRTVGVSINLSRCNIDTDKLIRFEIIDGTQYKERICEIAVKAFESDRRFHIKPDKDDVLAEVILREWIDKLNHVYVCRYKDEILGFIDIEDIDDKTSDIHLAAIDKTTKLPGVAMSLYAFAVKYAKENGKKHLTGRISSRNMAVMNIYSGLGAVFSDPRDIYVK